MTDTLTAPAKRVPMRLTVGIPAGWMQLPRFAGDQSGDEAIAAWATGIARAHHADPIQCARLGVALATLARQQRTGPRSRSSAATLVSIGDPATTSVCGVAFVETVARPLAHRELEPEEAAEACRVALDDADRFAPAGDDLRVRRRRVARTEIGGDPGLTIHELLAIRRPSGTRTLQRRVVQFRFPREPWVLTVTATSPRLVLDPPLDAAALAIAASTRMEVAR